MDIFKRSIIITTLIVLPLLIINYVKLDTKLRQLLQEQTVLTTILFLFPAIILIVRWTLVLCWKRSKEHYCEHPTSLSLFILKPKE